MPPSLRSFLMTTLSHYLDNFEHTLYTYKRIPLFEITPPEQRLDKHQPISPLDHNFDQLPTILRAVWSFHLTCCLMMKYHLFQLNSFRRSC